METRMEPQRRAVNKKKASAEPNILLKRERELRGWSQADVAEKIGAQPYLVTRWETGTTFPSPYYRQKLCTLFDKNAEELGLIKPVAKELMLAEESVIHATPEVKEASEPPHLVSQRVSRRTVCMGALAGVATGVLGGSFWIWSATHSQATPSNSKSSISREYVYSQSLDKNVNYVTWSPQGSLIACVDGDSTVKLLQAASGSLSMIYRGDGTFENCASWAPDQTRIASCGADRQVHIWDSLTGKLLLRYEKHKVSVTSVAWSPNGTLVASGSKDGEVHVWNPFTGEQLIPPYRGHTAYIQTVSWAPNSATISSCGVDGTIQLWYATTGQPVPTFRYQGPSLETVYQVIWSPDGTKLVSAHANGQVSIWDSTTGTHILTYTGHSGQVITAHWSPGTGKYIASAGDDTQIHIWNALTGERVLVYRGHTASIYEVSWSPDGKHLASAGRDHSMHVCRVIL